MTTHRSEAQQATFDTLTIGRAYVAAGLSIMPIARGTKEPDSSLLPRVWDESSGKTRPSWRIYQERQPSDPELVEWFGRTNAGIAIICGQVSGGLLVLDLESVEAFTRWWALAGELLPTELLARLVIVAT